MVVSVSAVLRLCFEMVVVKNPSCKVDESDEYEQGST
jgi:hypothetical protein